VESARRGIFKEKPHNSHPCEFARNGFIKEIKKWNSQGIVFARKGVCKERNWQGMGVKFARNGFARNRATGCHLPCGITLCYLLTDASERAPP